LPSKWNVGRLCPIPDLTDGELEVGLRPGQSGTASRSHFNGLVGAP